MTAVNQMHENIKDWEYVSYNSNGASAGPWLVSGGITGGTLKLKATSSGSKFNYTLGNVNVGAGLSTSPLDIDLSVSTYQKIVGTWPTAGAIGFGGFAFASGLKSLTPHDFAGPCMFYSCSGGGERAALGYNYIALGLPWCPPIIPTGNNAQSLANQFVSVVSRHAKAVIFEVSSFVTAVSVNIGHNLGVGFSSYAGAEIVPPKAGQIPGIGGTGGGSSPSRTTYRVHIVKNGESLSKISMQYFGTFYRWEDIYNIPENRKTIGSNPNFILPKTKLLIPN